MSLTRRPPRSPRSCRVLPRTATVAGGAAGHLPGETVGVRRQRKRAGRHVVVGSCLDIGLFLMHAYEITPEQEE